MKKVQIGWITCVQLYTTLEKWDVVATKFYKCKNHFNETKGDVGMSLHEK